MNFLEVVYILCTPRTGMLSSFETWIVSTVRHSGTKPWSFVLQILPYKTSWAGINEVKTKCCSHSLFNSPACIQVLTCGYFTKPECYVQLCSCFSFFNIEVSFLIVFFFFFSSCTGNYWMFRSTTFSKHWDLFCIKNHLKITEKKLIFLIQNLYYHSEENYYFCELLDNIQTNTIFFV